MPTFTSLKSYRSAIKKRIRKIGRIQSPKNASRFAMLTARSLAPRKTGETIKGIRRRRYRKTKTGWMVESIVTPKGKTGFMQNFWANRSSPHRSPRMWWNRNLPTVYGDGSHNNTGVPGFFHITALGTRNRYNDLTVREVHKIMSSK